MTTDTLSENDSNTTEPTGTSTSSHKTWDIEDLVTGLIGGRATYENSADEILFYVPDISTPIRCGKNQIIVLGREASDIQNVTHVDLSEFGALQQGVSRIHAFVHFVDGSLYVEDRGSRNGTWVNNRRIPPEAHYLVKSGDQIRLAEFVLTVFFSTKDEEQLTTEQFIRMAFTHSGGSWWYGIPPLSSVAMSVRSAQALIVLQSILHKLNHHSVQQFGLTALRLDIATESFQLSTANCDDLPSIVNMIEQWISAHPTPTRKLREDALDEISIEYNDLGNLLVARLESAERVGFINMVQSLSEFGDRVELSKIDKRDIVFACAILIGTGMKFYA